MTAKTTEQSLQLLVISASSLTDGAFLKVSEPVKTQWAFILEDLWVKKEAPHMDNMLFSNFKKKTHYYYYS